MRPKRQELGVSLGQEGTAGKGNELAAIKALLDTLLLVELFATAEALEFSHIDVQKRVWAEKDHGRLETRRAALVTDVSRMDKPMRENWKKLAAVGMLESEQETKGQCRTSLLHCQFRGEGC